MERLQESQALFYEHLNTAQHLKDKLSTAEEEWARERKDLRAQLLALSEKNSGEISETRLRAQQALADKTSADGELVRLRSELDRSRDEMSDLRSSTEAERTALEEEDEKLRLKMADDHHAQREALRTEQYKTRAAEEALEESRALCERLQKQLEAEKVARDNWQARHAAVSPNLDLERAQEDAAAFQTENGASSARGRQSSRRSSVSRSSKSTTPRQRTPREATSSDQTSRPLTARGKNYAEADFTPRMQISSELRVSRESPSATGRDSQDSADSSWFRF